MYAGTDDKFSSPPSLAVLQREANPPWSSARLRLLSTFYYRGRRFPRVKQTTCFLHDNNVNRRMRIPRVHSVGVGDGSDRMYSKLEIVVYKGSDDIVLLHFTT